MNLTTNHYKMWR